MDIELLKSEVHAWKESSKNWERDCYKNLEAKNELKREIAELKADIDTYNALTNVWAEEKTELQAQVNQLREALGDALNFINSNVRPEKTFGHGGLNKAKAMLAATPTDKE